MHNYKKNKLSVRSIEINELTNGSIIKPLVPALCTVYILISSELIGLICWSRLVFLLLQ